MRIGFDLDGIFIKTPQFIPGNIIERLYQDKSGNNPHYRIPGIFEQKVRQISHHPLFRPAIQGNIEHITKLHEIHKHKLYIISSRFGFLQKQTENILKKYNINQLFDGLYFNHKNKQPHLFKEEIIKKLGVEKYIEDDLDLALYLSSKIPGLKIYWVKNGKKNKVALPKNVVPISGIHEFLEKYI